MANNYMISDFYVKLYLLMIKLSVKVMPNHLWNWDETGFFYVVKPNEVITTKG